MVRPKDRPIEQKEKTTTSARAPKAPPPPTMLKASLDTAAPAQAQPEADTKNALKPEKQAGKNDKLRQQRTKTVKAVKVCPKCGAYMRPSAHFGRDGESAGFTSDNRLRSFGGVEVRTFECEKCHHTTQFQIDPFPKDIGGD